MRSTDIPISILIPTHGDMRHLAKSLPTFLESAPEPVEVLILNNDPEQNVITWLETDLGIAAGDQVHVVEMGSDAGFGRAVNRGIALSRGEFLFICNADLFPLSTYLEIMYRFFQSHSRAGLATGKILRYDLSSNAPTRVIDTAGLMFGRNRRFLTRGEGREDTDQFPHVEQVFGIDGAAVFARRAALESIRIDSEYFDESFFMYKDDWDLSWRIRLMDWECWYVPEAVAYHARTSKGLGETGYLSAIRAYHANEKAKPNFIRYHSLKNQWLMLVKNEDRANFVKDAPFIFSRECMIIGYNILFSPKTLLSATRFASLLPQAISKRRRIKRTQTATPRQIRYWLDAPDRQSVEPR